MKVRMNRFVDEYANYIRERVKMCETTKDHKESMLYSIDMVVRDTHGGFATICDTMDTLNYLDKEVTRMMP